MNSLTFVPQQVIPFGPCPSDEAEMLKRIEFCGRVAYKSEDKITEDSAQKFLDTMISHKHYSVLEHSNIVLAMDGFDWQHCMMALGQRNVYHPIRSRSGYVTIAGNVRAWLETIGYLASAPGYACHYGDFFDFHLRRLYPTIFGSHRSGPWVHRVDLVETHYQRTPDADLEVFTFKIVTNRGITHEIVRHRALSFTQESTRYVNYRHMGCEIMLTPEMAKHWDIVTQSFIGYLPEEVLEEVNFYHDMYALYKRKLDRGIKPQIARDVLANALKAEIYVSGRWSGWKHFIQLRMTSGAHPYVREIAERVHAYFLPLGMDAFDGKA